MPSTLPFMPADDDHITVKDLETWLWDAACVIRGATDAPKFKDFILPLVFYKRLSDVFDDEFAAYAQQYGDENLARQIVEADHLDALQKGRRPIVRFFVPADYRWQKLRTFPATGGLGEFVTTAMREVATLNPALDGVLNVKDYNERQSGERTMPDDRLEKLIEILTRHRLGLRNTEPDILGRAYEYLLRKFAEGQGQSAGEFYTPREVGWLIAELIDPKPHTTVYDPTCGSGGLLLKPRLLFEHRHKELRTQAPRLYGQELNYVTFAMAKMTMFLYDYTNSEFALGDTLKAPKFASEGAGLRRFDYVVANPMWNQDNYNELFYSKEDHYNRFVYGTPPNNNADWGWVQHIFASLNDTGRAAIVLDTGAVSRGSGNRGTSRERDIRKAFIENDSIECVILLPENLFYNTPSAGIILLLNRNKQDEHRQQFLFINASANFIKEKPKNVLTDAGIAAITEVYRIWKSRDKLSHVVTLAEVRSADYNLSPSQFVDIGDKVQHRPLGEILTDLQEAREVREMADKELDIALAKLGLNLEIH